MTTRAFELIHGRPIRFAQLHDDRYPTIAEIEQRRLDAFDLVAHHPSHVGNVESIAGEEVAVVADLDFGSAALEGGLNVCQLRHRAQEIFDLGGFGAQPVEIFAMDLDLDRVLEAEEHRSRDARIEIRNLGETPSQSGNQGHLPQRLAVSESSTLNLAVCSPSSER